MKPLPFLIAALSPLLLLREARCIDNPIGVQTEVHGTAAPNSQTQEAAVDADAASEDEAIVDLLEKRGATEASAPQRLAAEEQTAAAEIEPVVDQINPRRHHNRRRGRRLPPGRTFAPIGVPLMQQVATGQFGVTVRLSQDVFDGLRDGRNNLSNAEIFGQGFSIAPTQRFDRRYELEAMFGFDPRWNVYFVLPYATHSMDQDLGLGGENNVDSSGLGDVQIGGVFRSYDRGPTRVSFQAGISIPTGKVDETDFYDGTPNTTLPYSMQMGSGTFDLLPAAVVESRLGRVFVGARAAGRIHLQGAHDEGWFRSNSTRIDLWATRRIQNDMQGSLRVQADWWGDFHGEDPALVPLRNPLEDSLQQGGSRVLLLAGLGKDLDHAGNHHVAFEIGIPVDEWLDGPALSQDWSATIGWRMRF